LERVIMKMRRRYHQVANARRIPAYHEKRISLVGPRNAIYELDRIIKETAGRRPPAAIRGLSFKPVEAPPPVWAYTDGAWRSQPLPGQAGSKLSLQLYEVEASVIPHDAAARLKDFVRRQRPELLEAVTICIDPVVDSPFESEDAPFESEDAPVAVDPAIVANTVAGQPALERIGFNWLRQARPDLTGQNVTVLILDTLPVQGRLDVAPELVDFWIDWVGDGGAMVQMPDQPPPFPRIPAAEIHKYHGLMSASLVRHLAPGSTIIAARVLDDLGKGWSTTLIEAILWALAHRNSQTVVNGRRLVHDKLILNMSMGLPRTQAEEAEATCLLHALDSAARAATLTVAAAGNDSWCKPENPVEPAAYGFFADTPATGEQVIAVAGTDQLAEYAYFSNEAHISAPCRHIIADTGAHSHIEQTYGFSTVRWSGTSFATPQLTGLAALLWGAGRVPCQRIKQHIWRTSRIPGRWNGVREVDYLRAFRAI
jgi:hypothetical protein